MATKTAIEGREAEALPGHPPGSARFDWTLIALSFWFQIGGHLDGWAHQHLPQTLESFFTPWHAVLYSGFTAVFAFLGFHALRNVGRGYSLNRVLPSGYELSLVGAFLFAGGGVGDLVWHTIFGIEQNLEALLSPTHLLLALGAVLILSGPLRASLRRAPAGYTRAPWQAVASVTLMLSILTFMTQYAHPFARPIAGGNFPPEMDFFAQAIGVLSIMFQTALFMGLILFLMTRFELPTGAILFVLGLNIAFVATMAFGTFLIPAAGVAAILGELLYRLLRPSPTREPSLRLFAFSFPATFFLVYFVYLIAAAGTSWPVELWSGSIVLAGFVGWLLSYAFVPPRTAA